MGMTRTEGGGERLDAPFAVTFDHRLRFTEDVLGADRRVLIDLLEPAGVGPARVQFWIDDQLASARPDLAPRLEALAASDPGRIEQAGAVRAVTGGEAVKNDLRHLRAILRAFDRADL